MPDHPDLRPATAEELRETLAFALRFDGRQRRHDADGFLAAIAAERLEHFRRAGFVVMKRAAAPAH